MQKTTVFFIGSAIAIVTIVGVFLGSKYFLRHSEQIGETSTAEASNQQEQNQPSTPVVESNKLQIVTTPDQGDKDNPKIVALPENNPLASITLEKVTKAGFLDASLEVESFTGTIFNNIDISEYNNDEHLQYKILENSVNSGIISELIFPDSEIAGNIYENLKNKIKGNEIYTVNETNQYGDNSFFANNSEEKNSVFLVVKKDLRIYTFHYPARNHNKIKNLIGLL
jgi:hypothetical protein